MNRLGTLTYGPPRETDPRAVRVHVGEFFRRLRGAMGGQPLPYAWVPELHGDGEHFHVHFAVGRFVPRGLIERSWGRGFVHIKLLGDLPVGSGVLSEARAAAGYLSKYVAKTFADESAKRLLGQHRYDVAEGFRPVKVALRGRSADDVLAQASETFGQAPTVRWFSDEAEGWAGPPAVWAQWGR